MTLREKTRLGLIFGGRCMPGVVGQPAGGGTVAVITGTAASERLYGTGGNDVFDSDAGGDDVLRGLGGDDIYYLGRGTDSDSVAEEGGRDTIKIKADIAPGQVRLARLNKGYYGSTLYVQIVGADGITDELRVYRHFSSDTYRRVERIEFVGDGTVWGASEIALARIIGGSRSERLSGTAGVDIFDTDGGGDDALYGYGGDDIYYLGHGTESDTVHEAVNSGTDTIKIKAGILASQVRLSRVGEESRDLLVEIVGSNNRLTVVGQYAAGDFRGVEKIEFTDGTMWGADEIAAARVWIRGTSEDETLYGTRDKDVFDSNAGGRDTLRGSEGNDIYYLGYGTGSDIVQETGYPEGGTDTIRIKAGIRPDQVRLSWLGGSPIELTSDFLVEILGSGDKLTVRGQRDPYNADHKAIERIEFVDGTVVWNADDFAALARIRGTERNEELLGTNGVDIFDSDAGGDDTLIGRGGDDIYYLGAGTGSDTVHEGVNSGTDTIKIKAGIAPGDVRLSRVGDRSLALQVEIVGSNDKLIVQSHFGGYYSRGIEEIEFANGVMWDRAEIALAAPIHGTAENEELSGTTDVDVFDSNAGGRDTLRGFEGNDIYYLGYGTDHDVISEGRNAGVDTIKIKAGISPSEVRVVLTHWGRRYGSLQYFPDLRVEIVGSEDSLTIFDQNTSRQHRVEKIEFANGAVYNLRTAPNIQNSLVSTLSQEIAAFSAGEAGGAERASVPSHDWREAEDALATPS